MTFLFKIGLGMMVLVGGSVLLINNVPSLKANVIEAINPRVREQKLIEQLKSNLQALDASIATQLDAPNIAIDKAKTSQLTKLVEESKEILSEIGMMNEEGSGLVDGIISKATDIIIGGVTASSTPSPSPEATANIATSSTGSTSSSQTSSGQATIPAFSPICPPCDCE